MAQNSAKPWRLSRTITPKVTASAKGITISDHVSITLVNAVGFSNGWAELALKKPPPLVPSSLIASWKATGPSAMVCFAPFQRLRVDIARHGLRHAGRDQEHRVNKDDRQQHVKRDARQIDPEVAEFLDAAGRECPGHDGRGRDAGGGRTGSCGP